MLQLFCKVSFVFLLGSQWKRAPPLASREKEALIVLLFLFDFWFWFVLDLGFESLLGRRTFWPATVKTFFFRVKILSWNWRIFFDLSESVFFREEKRWFFDVGKISFSRKQLVSFSERQFTHLLKTFDEDGQSVTYYPARGTMLKAE